MQAQQPSSALFILSNWKRQAITHGRVSILSNGPWLNQPSPSLLRTSLHCDQCSRTFSTSPPNVLTATISRKRKEFLERVERRPGVRGTAFLPKTIATSLRNFSAWQELESRHTFQQEKSSRKRIRFQRDSPSSKRLPECPRRMRAKQNWILLVLWVWPRGLIGLVGSRLRLLLRMMFLERMMDFGWDEWYPPRDWAMWSRTCGMTDAVAERKATRGTVWEDWSRGARRRTILGWPVMCNEKSSLKRSMMRRWNKKPSSWPTRARICPTCPLQIVTAYWCEPTRPILLARDSGEVKSRLAYK